MQIVGATEADEEDRERWRRSTDFVKHREKTFYFQNLLTQHGMSYCMFIAIEEIGLRYELVQRHTVTLAHCAVQ